MVSYIKKQLKTKKKVSEPVGISRRSGHPEKNSGYAEDQPAKSFIQKKLGLNPREKKESKYRK